ncbi:hypothetical protein Rsub_04719 [Raphidocelis subcapitata]|uniref:Beta-glucuronidase C-terminal domain-containing protein n=1 Tax=Raphidocelis subcapitata TaxID=307507 RepID=A0A2V0P4I5_9CHLO|nr:hypothetical protein Rsub_04719 [Raphidocelis subcapitata]|eukprot:GBF91995.1 hypothetical protein Rsub_04719 [Raphidocelis subcapitata]
MMRRALLIGTVVLAAVGVAVATPLAVKASRGARQLPVSFSGEFAIDPDSRDQPVIPPSFLGISHEWPYAEEMSTQPKYMEMMNYLSSFGSGPINVRVGGGSTDIQDFVPPDAVWDSLAALNKGTGAKFIIGLNLEEMNPDLALRQMKAAQAKLPAGSIQYFEIGNEPNFFINVKGKSGEDYIATYFHEDWKRHAKFLTCNGGECDQGSNLFAGPAWGHVNVRNTTIDWFLQVNAKYVGLVTLHWYKATKETYNTPATLMEEAPIRKEADNLRELVRVSRGFGKPLRVAEMNTISNSGRDGVSNTLAAALWTLDAMFEVASTGAVGVNLHQGAGQNLYSALIRWYRDDGVTIRPVGIRPPFYGMALFQQAVRSNSQLLRSTASGGDTSGIKVWPLWGAPEKQVRVVVINKRADKAGNVTLSFSKGGNFGDAEVLRLVANSASPLDAQTGISLGGQYWDDETVMQGQRTTEKAPRAAAGGKQSWSIYMPPGSAAIVTIPKL